MRGRSPDAGALRGPVPSIAWAVVCVLDWDLRLRNPRESAIPQLPPGLVEAPPELSWILVLGLQVLSIAPDLAQSVVPASQVPIRERSDLFGGEELGEGHVAALHTQPTCGSRVRCSVWPDVSAEANHASSLSALGHWWPCT